MLEWDERDGLRKLVTATPEFTEVGGRTVIKRWHTAYAPELETFIRQIVREEMANLRHQIRDEIAKEILSQLGHLP